jgi:chitosanase
MRRSLGVLVVTAAVLVGVGPNAHAALTPSQHRIADQLVSLFENGTSDIQYCYIEALGDGRGYTAGRAGFTTATADLLDVVQRYTDAAPENELAPFLPRLTQLANEESDSLEGLDGFTEAWAAECTKTQMEKVQDEVVDDTYFQPAYKRARAIGLKQPLSIAAIYDAEIQHGGGTDRDGTPAMVKETTQKAKGTPRKKTASESKWLKTFLKVRQKHLLNAADPDTRAVWAESVTRVGVFEYLVKKKQWKLKAPLRIETPNYDETLPG